MNQTLSSKHKIERLLRHFIKSGVLLQAVEHFLAMFPATILFPVLINTYFQKEIIDIPLVLLSSGLGTIAFNLICRKQIPSYLGSSFAFISITKYVINTYEHPETGSVYSYILFTYVAASFLMLIFSLLFRFQKTYKIMNFLLPVSIMGPSISLIGLELTGDAIKRAGFHAAVGESDFRILLISFTTLGTIIICSVFRNATINNSSIIIGVVAGYFLYICFFGSDFIGFTTSDFTSLTIPSMHFFTLIPYADMLKLLLSVIPPTLVLFSENISRTAMILSMTGKTTDQQTLFNYEENSLFSRSLLAHSITMLARSLVGTVPNTMYAENIAVMGINSSKAEKLVYPQKEPLPIQNIYNRFSILPYILAGVIAIVISFCSPLLKILKAMPDPVIGGMELFLFGLIAAPGIQMLVDYKVDYTKVTNQLLTASVLIAGIGDFQIDLPFIELKGMSLGLLIGIALNLVFKCLRLLHLLNEQINGYDIIQICQNCYHSITRTENPDLQLIYLLKRHDTSDSELSPNPIQISWRKTEDYEQLFRKDFDTCELKIADISVLSIEMKNFTINIRSKDIPEEFAAQWCNDYAENIFFQKVNSTSADGLLEIRVDARLSLNSLKQFISDIFYLKLPNTSQRD